MRSKEANTKYYREWRLRHAENSREISRRYYERHREQRKAYREANKERGHAVQKEWRARNKERRRLHQLERLHTEPTFRLVHNLRSRFKSAMKGKKSYGKSASFWGCTVQELKGYLESKFRDGMNWENYGRWHVDHIRPVSSFDLRDPEQIKECFGLANLQPLWAADNLHKSSKRCA